jgi:hypothetical protein
MTQQIYNVYYIDASPENVIDPFSDTSVTLTYHNDHLRSSITRS